jgi:Uncharacterized protein conserved in bacteria (DUF2263)
MEHPCLFPQISNTVLSFDATLEYTSRNPFEMAHCKANRNLRKTIALETMKVLKSGQYVARSDTRDDFDYNQSEETNTGDKVVSIQDELWASIRGTQCYRPGDLRRLVMQKDAKIKTPKQTLVEVVNETTLAGARALICEPSTRVCVLNFASARAPGGGFQSGALSQEEDLARNSGLYACLVQGGDEGELEISGGDQRQGDPGEGMPDKEEVEEWAHTISLKIPLLLFTTLQCLQRLETVVVALVYVPAPFHRKIPRVTMVPICPLLPRAFGTYDPATCRITFQMMMDPFLGAHACRPVHRCLSTNPYC